MKSAILFPVLVLLVGVGGLLPVHAEESPAATYDAKRATLPWPASAKAFSFEGQLIVGGAPVGAVTMKAEPQPDAAGAARWKTTMQMSVGGGAMMQKTETLFDAKLAPVSGTYYEKKGPEELSKTWKVEPAGVQVTTGSGESATPTTIEHKGSFVTAIPSMFLFCQLVDFSAGTYKTDLFDPDDQKFVTVSWTCGQIGMWDAQKAKLVTGERGDGKTLEAGFDPSTGELMGVRMTSDGTVAEIRKGEAPKVDGDLFKRQAATAQEAAVQAALSFATADFELLERVVHWPSVHEHMSAANPELGVDEPTLKALLMGQFRKSLTPQGERAMIAPVLAALAPTLEVTGDDKESAVAFGPQFRNLLLTVGKRDGKWYLVKLPSK